MQIEYEKTYRLSMYNAKGLKQQVMIKFHEDQSLTIEIRSKKYNTPAELEADYPNYYLSSRYPEFSELLARNNFISNCNNSKRVYLNTVIDDTPVKLKLKVNFTALDHSAAVLESKTKLYFSPEDLKTDYPDYVLTSNDLVFLEELKALGYKSETTNDLANINISLPGEYLRMVKKDAQSKGLSASKVIASIIIQYYKK